MKNLLYHCFEFTQPVKFSFQRKYSPLECIKVQICSRRNRKKEIMALKITEVNGKLVLEGNVNFATEELLKQHIQIIKGITPFEDKGKRR